MSSLRGKITHILIIDVSITYTNPGNTAVLGEPSLLSVPPILFCTLINKPPKSEKLSSCPLS